MAAHYWDLFRESFFGYARYLWTEITYLHWGNYFYWLIGISAVVYALELLFPWRRDQPAFRQDFWLDTFYMFFNFFLFSLVGYAAISNVVAAAFSDFLAWAFGIRNLVALNVQALPGWAHIALLFVARDFIQWNIHRLLHASPALWEIHKVHHSVEQMGYAAHLRYHFGENIVYRTLEYLPLALLGYGLSEYLLVNLFTIAIGHLNHSNIRLPLGPLRYVLNNPQMHIWHHSEVIPDGRSGVNFGLTLSVWDYLFGTAWMPKDGRDIALGYPGMAMPRSFLAQLVFPFRRWWRRLRGPAGPGDA
ncbi:MAG: sterol desaturase family protein [Verrucomicrobia bacterium]|nr:sterol desaturase family protein [Verrucomicrobiota bacterium]